MRAKVAGFLHEISTHSVSAGGTATDWGNTGVLDTRETGVLASPQSKRSLEAVRVRSVREVPDAKDKRIELEPAQTHREGYYPARFPKDSP